MKSNWYKYGNSNGRWQLHVAIQGPRLMVATPSLTWGVQGHPQPGMKEGGGSHTHFNGPSLELVLIISAHSLPADGALISWPHLSPRESGNGSPAMWQEERGLHVVNSKPLSATISNIYYVSLHYYVPDTCDIQRLQINFPSHQGFQVFSPKVFNNFPLSSFLLALVQCHCTQSLY